MQVFYKDAKAASLQHRKQYKFRFLEGDFISFRITPRMHGISNLPPNFHNFLPNEVLALVLLALTIYSG